MRMFYLENESGDRIDLNSTTDILLTEPSGLGLEFNDTYADIGEGFFRLISKRHNQRQITCKLNFIVDPYRVYNEFISWLMAAKELYLIYKPKEIEYYIRIGIRSITKGEINKYGLLESQASFNYMTPWYQPSPLPISFPGTNDAFRVDVSKLDGPDVLVGSTASKYSAIIEPVGHFPAGFYIEFHGVAENPEIKLQGQNSGTVYGDCKITERFAANTGFKLSTNYDNAYVSKILANGSEVDLLPKVDLTLEPFFKMPLTEPCVLKVIDDDALHGDLSAKIFFYYRSV